MKRSNRIILALLEELVERHDGVNWVQPPFKSVEDPKVATEHLRLMAEAELIDIVDLSNHGEVLIAVRRIHMAGQDALDVLEYYASRPDGASDFLLDEGIPLDLAIFHATRLFQADLLADAEFQNDLDEGPLPGRS